MLTTKRGSIIHPTRQADYFLPRDQYSLAVLQFRVDGMLGVWAGLSTCSTYGISPWSPRRDVSVALKERPTPTERDCI
jgi:hypothetical protein